MALYTYSPKDITVSLAGLHTVTGYVDGTFVRIVRNTKPFESQTAMDGTIERMYHHDEGYNIEITLAQSSPSNNILSTLHNIDLVTRMVKFPMMIRDSYGQTTFFAATSWINTLPEVTFSNQIEQRVWTFTCTEAALTVGGNASTSLIEDAILAGSSFLPVLQQFGVFGG